MKTNLFFAIVGLTGWLLLGSCQKENLDFQSDIQTIPTMEVDTISWQYQSNDSTYFLSQELEGLNDINTINLVMKKDCYYRITATQPNSEQSNVDIVLLSNNGDTITLSESIQNQDVLYFYSSKNQVLTISTRLAGYYNTSLDYRLLIEIVKPYDLSWKGFAFRSFGHFSVVKDSLCFRPMGSYWARLSAIDKPFNDTSQLSFKQSFTFAESDNSFGIWLGNSIALSAYQSTHIGLPSGYFLKIYRNQFELLRIEHADIQIVESGTLTESLQLDNQFSFEPKSGQSHIKRLYINQELVCEIDLSSLGNLFLFGFAIPDHQKSLVYLYDFKPTNF